jgi:hypothetical protein
MWQVTAFLSHMDKLSPRVSAAWNTAVGGSPSTDSLPDGAKMDMKDKKKMDMPMH